MGSANDCTHNTDMLKLIREGTSQDQRLSRALNPSDPAFPLVDDHGVPHRMVFARAYTKYLKYFNLNNAEAGDWQSFFNSDVSVRLAVAAIQNVEEYRSTVTKYFTFLKNLHSQADEEKGKEYLGYLFSGIGMLAGQLDELKNRLPSEIPLQGALRNMIQSQLAPAVRRLIAYYKADANLPEPNRLVKDVKLSDVLILGTVPLPFSSIYKNGLSKEWWLAENVDTWDAYKDTILPEAAVYGSSVELFERINHIATHNLFTSIFDQFLKALARTVAEANQSLAKTYTDWDHHEPHYALFLAFLQLFEYVRSETNTLTKRHLDLYYR
ncbi:MAG: hypothetical protein WCP33_06180, partial [Deltaproteobacteria bacterium]